MQSILQSVFFAAVCAVGGVCLLGVVAGCGGPDIADGAIACGPAEDCPPDFACGFDGRCYLATRFACDNGVIDPGESCDPKVLCPESCNDGNSCTKDALLGSPDTCDVTCKYAVIETCANGDGCCPAACSPANDDDCSQTCGDNVVDPGETCDPVSSCPGPDECTDGSACTTDSATGSANNCNAACSFEEINDCVDGDRCCPSGCGPATDKDCPATCGDGRLDQGETCDPPEFPCPTSCDDDINCTNDTLIGSAASCTAACLNSPISACGNVDGCCPNGCTREGANGDLDCSPSCGNGMVDDDQGETCDPPIFPCPENCDDNDVCTTDSKTGSANNCNVECSNSPITECVSDDGCCPDFCLVEGDTDCMGDLPDAGLPDAGIPDANIPPDANLPGMDADVGLEDGGIAPLGDGGVLPPV